MENSDQQPNSNPPSRPNTDTEPNPGPNQAAYLPYPVSTLSPAIIPQDLSTFKSRGISQVERDLQLKLQEIQNQYRQVIDHYNWNKLVYESQINFEPIIGETYHLYVMRGSYQLSMISPHQWPHRHIATLRLNVDRQWELLELGPNVNPEHLFHPQPQGPHPAPHEPH